MEGEGECMQSETLIDLAPQYGRLFNTPSRSPPPRVLHHNDDRLVRCSVRTHTVASCGRILSTFCPCHACQGRFKCIPEAPVSLGTDIPR